MRYITKAELADLLRVSVRTVTTYMSQGLLPQPFQLGRKLLWSEDTVAQFLQARHMPAPRAAGPVRRGRPRKAVLG